MNEPAVKSVIKATRQLFEPDCDGKEFLFTYDREEYSYTSYKQNLNGRKFSCFISLPETYVGANMHLFFDKISDNAITVDRHFLGKLFTVRVAFNKVTDVRMVNNCKQEEIIK